MLGIYNKKQVKSITNFSTFYLDYKINKNYKIVKFQIKNIKNLEKSKKINYKKIKQKIKKKNI